MEDPINSGGLGDYLVIAEIVKARGIRGEVACDLRTDFPERFDSLKRVAVVMPDGRQLALDVESRWFHKNRVILKFTGYDSMSAAQTLAGGRLVVPESDASPLEEGEFFEHQLAGLEVVNKQGVKVGEVTAMIKTGGADVLVVQGVDGKEHLVPFADEICSEVDLNARRITIDPPRGLLEL